jgi:hypothetical protein
MGEKRTISAIAGTARRCTNATKQMDIRSHRPSPQNGEGSISGLEQLADRFTFTHQVSDDHRKL